MDTKVYNKIKGHVKVGGCALTRLSRTAFKDTAIYNDKQGDNKNGS